MIWIMTVCRQEEMKYHQTECWSRQQQGRAGNKVCKAKTKTRVLQVNYNQRLLRSSDPQRPTYVPYNELYGFRKSYTSAGKLTKNLAKCPYGNVVLCGIFNRYLDQTFHLHVIVLLQVFKLLNSRGKVQQGRIDQQLGSWSLLVSWDKTLQAMASNC